jgi:protease I
VLLILPSRDFYYPDYSPVRDALVRAGAEVLVAAPTAELVPPMPVRQQHTPVKPDLVLSQVQGGDYDAIHFCGGTGVEEFVGTGSQASEARRVIGEALAAKKFVTALGIGPVVLADAGILKDRRATCHEFGQPRGTYIQRLEQSGAQWLNQPVVVDGPIITGRGSHDARTFAAELLQQLGAE